MITITNTAGDNAGICKYQVKINQKPIAVFYHDRKDGLSVCLRKAADAAETQEKADEIDKKLKLQEYGLRG